MEHSELKNFRFTLVEYTVKTVSLSAETCAFHAHVQIADKSLEVRPHECNPTSVFKRIMKKHSSELDFLLYIGEPITVDVQDDHIFTCSVGKKNQKYWLSDSHEVLDLILELDEDQIQGKSSE